MYSTFYGKLFQDEKEDCDWFAESVRGPNFAIYR